MRFAANRQFLILLSQVVFIIILALYCYIKYGKEVHQKNTVKPVLIAIGNSFGFLILFMTLGYSIVAIPRHVLKMIITASSVREEMAQLDTIAHQKNELLIILENEYKLFKGLKENYTGNKQIEKWLNIGVKYFDSTIMSQFSSGIDSYYDEEMIKTTLKKITASMVRMKIKDIDWTNDAYRQLIRKEEEIKAKEAYYRKTQDTRQLYRRNWIIRGLFIFVLLMSLITMAIEVVIPFQRKFEFNIYKFFSKHINDYVVYYFYILIIIYLIVLFQYANMRIEIKYLYRLRIHDTNYGSLIFYIM